MADAVAERSPWAGVMTPGRFGRDGSPGLVIAEPKRTAAAAMIARRGKAADLVAAAATWGVELPRRPAWAARGDVSFIWTGPDQWLVRGLGRFAELEAELSGLARCAVLIDQSHARALLTLSGDAARDTLAKGFEIDLHPRAFWPGDAAVTVAAGVSAILWQLDDRPTYGIAVPRSMAGSFWHWLSVSAAPFGYRIDRAA